jgi:hypothetical protein
MLGPSYSECSDTGCGHNLAFIFAAPSWALETIIDFVHVRWSSSLFGNIGSITSSVLELPVVW